MATYAQLKKQIDQLSKQADAARQLEKGATLTKVREAVAAFELTVDEVFGSATKPGKKKTAKAAATPKRTAPKGAGQAKYRDPKSGAVWTGFGRAPAWMASAKDRTKFLIAQQPAVEVKPTEKAVAKLTKKAVAKKATTAPKVKSVAKKTEKAGVAKLAKVANKAATVAPKASAKAPAKKSVKVATSTTPSKASRKPVVNAPSASATAPLTELAAKDVMAA